LELTLSFGASNSWSTQTSEEESNNPFNTWKRNNKKELLINYLITTIGKIRAIKYMVSPVGSRPMRHVITIASLEPWFCKEFLRFKVPGLRRLHNVLDLPVICKLSNNGSMMSEEVLIRGLYELASGEKQSSIASRFGRHYTDQGRAFQYFINHMFIRYKALVCNNLEWWHAMGFMKYSNQLIEQKCAYSGERAFALFIDCNCLETSMPGGGPADEGANSRR
jgi:hypothetical protein